MTENEAKLLEKLYELANDSEVDMYSVANLNFFFEESANTIRKLIEEIQAYRTIGLTPELIEAMQGHNIAMINDLGEYQQIGTIEDFKALKEADMKGANRAVDEFANYLHRIAKKNNGLRLSSETKSLTHPCIFDYLEEFKNEQTCKEET